MPNQKMTLSAEQLENLKPIIKGYFLDELDMEIGDLQTDLFIDFIDQKVGKYFYNAGITQAKNAIKDKAEDLVLLYKE